MDWRRPTPWLLSAFAFLLLAGVSLRSQQQPTFSADVKVVNVLATVRNKQGQIIRNLTKDDFTLEEDGHPQTIHYFGQETDLPLTLGLLVDTSLSQMRVLEQERSASYSFLDEMLREKDMAFVIHFEGEVELLQDLTSSHKALESALGSLHTPQVERFGGGNWPHIAPAQWPGSPGQWPGSGGPGQWPGGGTWPGGGGTGRGSGRGRGRGSPQMAGNGTALYDAVFLGSDELMKKQTGRKAIIILSDGVDNVSKVTLARAIEAAQRSDTLVYSILFSDPSAYDSQGGYGGGPWGGMGRRGGYPRFPEPHPDGKRILERISTETGGRFFEVSKKQTIEQIYSTIQEELRNQYSLGYTPDRTDAGPGYRKIHLAAKQKDLTVRTREGYYAN